MMFLQNSLRAVVFFFCVHGTTANVFSTFRFSRLLYAFNLCTHESHWCPMPPCDLNSFHEPICNNYVCRRVEPRGKECVFIGNCNGDPECIATAQYLGVSATDYYGDSSTFDESNSGEQYQAEASEVSDSYSTSTSGSDPTASVERSWWPYALLGGVLAAFIALTAWRRRRVIAQGALSEELAPKATRATKGRLVDTQVGYNLA